MWSVALLHRWPVRRIDARLGTEVEWTGTGRVVRNFVDFVNDQSKKPIARVPSCVHIRQFQRLHADRNQHNRRLLVKKYHPQVAGTIACAWTMALAVSGAFGWTAALAVAGAFGWAAALSCIFALSVNELKEVFKLYAK